MRSRTLAILVSLAAVAGFGFYLGGRIIDGDLPLPRPARACAVSAVGQDGTHGRDGASARVHEVKLNSEQMSNAATISAIGVSRKMPERAIVVALATAYQESGLENLAGGDRDSVGLFQQRPSQGWGTVEQIRDPRYAAHRFYAALKRVRGWEKMRITEAAQAVQRSAFPEAYEKWADEASVLASALLGHATGAVTCSVDREPAMRGSTAAAALTAELTLDWGRVRTTTPAELVGVAVPANDVRAGWRYAHWLVSHAGDHGVKRVRFANLQWTAEEGAWESVSESTTGLVIAEVFADV